MGWDEAAACDLGLNPPISGEFLPDEIECPVTLDFLRDIASSCHLTGESSWEALLPNEVPVGPLEDPGPRPTGESFRPWTGLFASALAHVAVLAALLFLSLHTSTGSGESAGRAVLVHLIDNDLAVPQEESPGTIDSAASVATLAERRRHTSREAVKRPPKESSSLVGNEVIWRQETSEYEGVTTKNEEVVEEKRHDDDNLAREDQKAVDSASRSDSVSSNPSVASSPRAMVPAAGAEAADFRAGVLSAIEAAVYFPKKALLKGIRGQALVQFTIHRSGSIVGLSLVKPSGSGVLDEAALKIIEKAAKRFPKFPEHIPRESVSYAVPIVFKAKSSADY